MTGVILILGLVILSFIFVVIHSEARKFNQAD